MHGVSVLRESLQQAVLLRTVYLPLFGAFGAYFTHDNYRNDRSISHPGCTCGGDGIWVHGTGCLTCTKLRGPRDLWSLPPHKTATQGHMMHNRSVSRLRLDLLRSHARFTFHSSIKPHQLRYSRTSNLKRQSFRLPGHVCSKYESRTALQSSQ